MMGGGMDGGGFGGGKGKGKGFGTNMPTEAPKLFPSVFISDIPKAWDQQTLHMMIDDDEVVQIKLLPSKLDAETCCAMVRFRSQESAEGAVNRLKGLPVTTAGGQAGTKYLGARIANAPAKLPGQRWAMAKRMMGHPAGWQGPSSSESSSESDDDGSSSSSSSTSEETKKKRKEKKKKKKEEAAAKKAAMGGGGPPVDGMGGMGGMPGGMGGMGGMEGYGMGGPPMGGGYQPYNDI